VQLFDKVHDIKVRIGQHLKVDDTSFSLKTVKITGDTTVTRTLQDDLTLYDYEIKNPWVHIWMVPKLSGGARVIKTRLKVKQSTKTQPSDAVLFQDGHQLCVKIHQKGKLDLKAEYEDMSIEELEVLEAHLGKGDKTTNKVKIDGLCSMLGKYNRLKEIQEKVTLAMDEFKNQVSEAIEEQFEGDEPKDVIEKLKKFVSNTLAVKQSEQEKSARAVRSLVASLSSVGAGTATGTGVPVGTVIDSYGVAGAPDPPINQIFIPGAHVPVPDTDVEMAVRSEDIP
jgi:hypothetical protein